MWPRARRRSRGRPTLRRLLGQAGNSRLLSRSVRVGDIEFEDVRAEGALEEAERARERAYAPYSRFNMGAAVVTERDAVVPGALVENVSLGLAMCAERAALFSVVAQDLGKPESSWLVAPRTSGELTWPCGARLQVAMELGGSELLVVASDGSGDVAQARLHELASRLPFKSAR